LVRHWAQSIWNRLNSSKVLEWEQVNWKVVEQFLILIEKLFISTKGKVERLEGKNESFIEILQKQQLKL
jgi:IS1 family transposase